MKALIIIFVFVFVISCWLNGLMFEAGRSPWPVGIDVPDETTLAVKKRDGGLIPEVEYVDRYRRPLYLTKIQEEGSGGCPDFPFCANN